MRKLIVFTFAAIVAMFAIAATAVAKTDNSVATSAAQAAAITCGSTRTIGMAAPITGPRCVDRDGSAGLGEVLGQQLEQAEGEQGTAGSKMIDGDTQLGVNTSFAVSVAQSFASNSKLLAVVGPAGSQEVVASTSAYESGGLGFVSGSATRTSLADGVTDGNRIGYFYSDGAQRRDSGPDGR